MKRYFLARSRTVTGTTSPEEILKYRRLIIAEMEKMGATAEEMELLQDETILNCIRNHRKPEDVAWAILQ